MLDHIFEAYDAVLVLDTETTGISCRKDEIIELAVLKAGQDVNGLCELETMDEFVRLSEGRHLPEKIVELTGITEQMLLDDGISKRQAAEMFSRMFGERTLIVAYNAQFDLCFLYYFLAQFGMADVLKGAQMLDALTVYKDRRPYPHKLQNAIDAYGLLTQNTHRAVDDARATLELLYAMAEERDDLGRYVNLFGFNPKYGAPKPRIASIRYVPQGYQETQPLYEKAAEPVAAGT